MVIDASALLAILFGEPERDEFARAVAAAGVRLVGAVNAFEAAAAVAARKGPEGSRELDLLFHGAGIEVVSFTEAQLRLAREAYNHFGKGRHPAGLNLGDCCAYALARHAGEPLLFKGDDFPQTDVSAAVSSGA
ncbi:MAG: VapC toxin family PIN domain ribonuclease [Acidobacteria bacterium]|jgi:ribonuclease VapC|nr:VapC toxin family PIN domain ribonuclease [Acidobacteriota bacterium]MDP7338685.1 type II toxin-antitoxin system VapC family toxin [Vicinamibacterales bacterium]MDP7478296.1 type II toxin-antitoxin system VapC family toxin [Vicinamibacterales bacterium]MDP7690761.1 type II toxin-antitoxin system VapC family toxin [Vicinamibacterales bacterium]HJN44929.1 type II toxin-antitoxin system VapC family toxin [Vicinamibacterales bacterium]|tara:strand:- start:203 stop:604 length:402 start_codon:yes stop_codon:yes gene_type:complete